MKKVYSAPSVIPCDMLRSLLDSEGIPSMLKNEGGSTIVGRGYPIPSGSELFWAWPEVWVNDHDFEEAAEIVAAFQYNSADTPETP